MLVPLELLIAITGLASGLVGTYVGLQNRALLAEVRKELAENENRIFERVNGKYVRSSECHLREAAVRVLMAWGAHRSPSWRNSSVAQNAERLDSGAARDDCLQNARERSLGSLPDHGGPG